MDQGGDKMLKAPLEGALEKALRRNGIDFMERRFREDIELAAQMDDVIFPSDKIRKLKSPEERILYAMGLTRHQQIVKGEELKDLFFERDSAVKDGLSLRYVLLKKMNSPFDTCDVRQAITQIIQYPHYGSEVVTIFDHGDEKQSGPEIGFQKGVGHEEKRTPVMWLNYREGVVRNIELLWKVDASDREIFEKMAFTRGCVGVMESLVEKTMKKSVEANILAEQLASILARR